MKLERKHRQLIVLGIGVVIIIFGLLQALLKFKVDQKITDEVTFVLMIIAAALLFTKDKKKSDDNPIDGTEKGNAMTDSGGNAGGETADNAENAGDEIINKDEKESVDDQ